MFLSSQKFNFKYRKSIHFSLIGLIVVLQVILVIIYYNETYNEAKLSRLSTQLIQNQKIEKVIKQAQDRQLKAQADFSQFMESNTPSYFESYKKYRATLVQSMDSLAQLIQHNPSWRKFQNQNPTWKNNQIRLNNELALLLAQEQPKNAVFNANAFSLQPYNFKETLNSVQVESVKEVDTVKKKGFFSRIGNALKGKSDVQKEKENVLITMKFGKEVSTASITSQLEKAFLATDAYYANEFLKLKNSIRTTTLEQAKFVAYNKQLLHFSADLVNGYAQSTAAFESILSQKFHKQNATNKKIRNNAIFGLVAVVILISIVLLYFTRIAFVYEKRLTHANIKINQNLNFKNRIVAMISHEIRLPSSIISLYSRLIADKIKDKELQELFHSLQFTTNSLTQLSEQILAYSKQENKKILLNASKFNLTDTLKSMSETLQKMVASNGSELIINTSLNAPVWVNSDEVKLCQLLYNCIGNAAKFTTNGMIWLAFESFETVSQINLSVQVQDTGKGIPDQVIEHIFDDFYQGVVTEKVHNLGAGLGLTLCKELVELFGGTIAVTSQLNVGTTVSFNLYLDKANQHS